MNPYSLPNRSQFLAYWHYRKKAEIQPDTWKISHKIALSEDEKEDDDGVGSEELQQEDDDGLAEKVEAARRRKVRACNRIPFSKSRYVNDGRRLFRLRLLVGQIRDGCLLLDRQREDELSELDKVEREFKERVSSMNEFVARDHEESMSLLFRANEAIAASAKLTALRDETSRHYGQVRLEVYHWEEAWRTVRACHGFLYQLAPNNGSPTAMEPPNEDVEVRLGEGGNIDVNVAAGFESLIAKFEREAQDMFQRYSAKDPEELGFRQPDDLLQIFRAMEHQNLNALILIESLTGTMDTTLARIDAAEGRVRRDVDEVVDSIRELELAIESEERRGQRLEKSCDRLIQQHLRSLVCSEEALRVRVLVEDAYETCLGKNEAELDQLTMARALEAEYERLSTELDRLPSHLVTTVEREGFKREMREMQDVEEAVKKFKLMNRLLNALKRIMEPTMPKHRTLMRRSPPDVKSTSAPAPTTNKDTRWPTVREALHSDLFGKMCKIGRDQGDSASYELIQNDNDDKEKLNAS